jgi:DNA-binding MarR family transcriptional regulator
MKMNIVSNGEVSDMVADEHGDHWLGKFVPYLNYRITSQLNRRLREKLKRSGINIARWRVLAVLKDNGRMNIGQIVKRTLIEQPTVSRIVDRLEREGLASREISEEDSRFVQVDLTRSGEKAFREIYPTATEHQKQVLKDFTQQEIKTLIGFLERMLNNIESGEQ